MHPCLHILAAFDFSSWSHPENIATLVQVLVIAAVGLPLVMIASSLAGRAFTRRVSEHHGIVARKALFYAGIILLIVTILIELGFNLSALLGAAGIASIAIGFAAQTSLSNIISGIFLYAERPFQTGDMISVGDTRGVVLSIDLMAVKLRTLDNQYIRVPNETIIKTQVTNITRFPIRRMDINVGVAYKEDVGRVIQVLKEIADANPYSLDEPAPLVVFKDFGDSSLNFMLGIWFEKSQFLLLKNSIMEDIKKRFDAEGIEIPFPHRTLYTGSITDPFPVAVVEGKERPNSAPGEQAEENQPQ